MDIKKLQSEVFYKADYISVYVVNPLIKKECFVTEVTLMSLEGAKSLQLFLAKN